MRLRPRQEQFVDRCCEAIQERGNTLGVAPTGAGKTVMLSAVGGRIRSSRKQSRKAQLVIQHRDELVAQNATTYLKMNPDADLAVIDGSRKRWHDQGVNFAMIQTLVRNLDDMPILESITIDEAHHASAPSYMKVLEWARGINPKIKVFGVTATPARGDNKSLEFFFNNCADQITLSELIRDGHLVRPRTFMVDLGVNEALRGVRKTLTDYDMTQVDRIMNKRVINDKVVNEWQHLCGDRKTVVFCSTVEHAEEVRDAFARTGKTAAVVHGEMNKGQRKGVLASFERGDFQVLCNVAVLTEGWDCQTVSCVVLLRPCSWKSTMIQMIGRGLRTVDPERYPGVRKDDCYVLDFGTSVATHGSLEQDVDYQGAGTKECPSCESVVPIQATECPICAHEFPHLHEGLKKICPDCEAEVAINLRQCECGYEFPIKEQEGSLEDFVLSEVDILDASPFRYMTMFGGMMRLSEGFTAFAVVAHAKNGRTYTVGGRRDEAGRMIEVKLLADTEHGAIAVQAGDDWMREWGDKKAARKTKRWISEPATEKQRQFLGPGVLGMMATKYEASCHITWRKVQGIVGAKVQSAMSDIAA